MRCGVGGGGGGAMFDLLLLYCSQCSGDVRQPELQQSTLFLTEGT